MNKSTIPVAVILAASAVPVQAQDAVASYTQKALEEKCQKAIITLGTYPEAVKTEYTGQFNSLLLEIQHLENPSQETLEAKDKALDELIAAAAKAEQDATENYRELLTAIDNEKAAQEAAAAVVEAIKVPSVKAEYEEKLKDLPLSDYTEEQKKEFYNNPDKAKEALDAVNANITAYDNLATAATQADENAQTEQATAKTTLLSNISEAKTVATTAKETVEGYIAYDNQSTDVAAIDAAITALGNLETQVNNAAEALTLTEAKQKEISDAVTAQNNAVSNTRAAAERAAKDAAKAYSEKAVNNLPDIADDDQLKAEKEAVNKAVNKANAKAEVLKDIIVQADRTELEKELEGLLNDVATAQTAYDTAVKNLAAYNAGKDYIAALQTTYDKQNLDLQELKIKNEINKDVYSIANNNLNGVAKTIQDMTEKNNANYEGKKYENGTEDEDYTSLTGTLTTAAIEQIVTDAKNASSAYDVLANNLAEAKKDADNVATDNQTIKDELASAYNEASTAVEDYAKGKMSKADAQKAIDEYNKTITDAQADVTAYNEAMTLINSLQADLDAVSLPELAEDTTYPDAELIKGLDSQKKTFQERLDEQKTNIENSFTASPRTIQTANEALQDNGIKTDIPAWKTNAQGAYDDYQTWLSVASDEVIYNEVKTQVDKLEKKLEGASKGMLGYTEDEAAIVALNEELKAHGEGHTGCAENYSKWTTEINRISKSIDDHQAAYDANQDAYKTRLAEINDLYDDTYYKAIANTTNKGEANEKIKAAKTLLDQFNRKQTVTVDKNVQAVTDAINTAKDVIASNYLQEKGWKVNNSYNSATQIIGSEASELNPSLVYSTKLDGYYKEFKKLDTKYYHNLAKYDEIASEEEALNTLKKNIEAIVPDAKANLVKYNEQKNAQTRAKSEWASYYSQVGALYSGEQFFGAQALYQGQLNDCLALINGYDAKIEECYNNGTSVDFGKATEESIGYDASIEANRVTMENVLKDATANKNAYTGQVVDVNILNTSYKDAYDAVDKQIKDAEDALISAETEDDKAALNERIAELRGYMTQLEEDIKPRIQNLEKTVLEKVNAGESVGYSGEFDTENIAVSEAIQDIVDNAKGTYDEAVKEHNKIVKANFDAEYKTATDAYNAAVYDISKYASFQHALDENGVSGYAASIQTANEALFPLYEKLKGIKAEFNAKFSNESRFDAKQAYRAQVKEVEEEIAKALDAFYKATQQIADANSYAAVISDLAKRYEDIVADIKDYNEAAKALFEEIEGGNVAKTTKAYADMEDVNKGPQVIDDLKFEIKNGVESNLETAYSEAATADVNAHISAAESIIKDYETKLGTDYPLSTSLKTEIDAAKENVENAKTALAESKDIPSDHDNIVAMLSGIDTSLAEAEEKAKVEQSEAVAEKAIQDQFDAYDAQIKLIADGSDETGALGINDYKSPFEYADKLTELLAEGDNAVAVAKDANEKAKKLGYNYTDSPIQIGTNEVKMYKHNWIPNLIITVEEYNNLRESQKKWYKEITVSEPIYYPGTAKEYVEEKIAEAQTALDNIEKKVAELEATDAKAIVDGMHDKVQKTLIPLYNRAVANGGDETELEAVYDEISELLASLTITDDMSAEQIEELASEENQTAVDTKIAELSKKIADLDNELKAYNSLTEQLDAVKAELEKVKAEIDASDFADELNDAFASSISNIESNIADTERKLDADHANNRCGKETAKVKEEHVEAISTSIKALSEEIDEKTKELQKAKEDAAILAANAEAYEAEKAKLDGLTTTLDSTWETLCKDNVDVWTEFNDTKDGIATQITEALTALEAEKTAADAEPRNISTEAAEQAYTDIDAAIKKMAEDAVKRQSAYNAQLAAVQQSINDLATAYDELEISDIAAAEAEVIAARQTLEQAIADLQEKEITPDNIAETETAVTTAEEQLEALKALIEEKTYIPGDINESGKVDMDDLLFIRNIVLGKVDTTELSENQMKAGDLNGDGQFTIADLVMLNNIYVYGNPTGPAVSYTKGQLHIADPGSLSMQIAAERMDIALNSEMPYAAIQMDVTLPAGVVLNEMAFAGDTEKVLVATNMLDNGACRIVMYSADGSAMLPGAATLLHLRLAGEGNGIVSIDNIIAATSDGTSYSLAAITGNQSISTGISAIDTENEANGSIFDTNGVVRQTLKKGVNIVRDAAGRVKKILVK